MEESSITGYSPVHFKYFVLQLLFGLSLVPVGLVKFGEEGSVNLMKSKSNLELYRKENINWTPVGNTPVSIRGNVQQHVEEVLPSKVQHMAKMLQKQK